MGNRPYILYIQLIGSPEDWRREKKTCNTGHSLVITDPTTTPAVASLAMGERTGSRVLWRLWSHVLIVRSFVAYNPSPGSLLLHNHSSPQFFLLFSDFAKF